MKNNLYLLACLFLLSCGNSHTTSQATNTGGTTPGLEAHTIENVAGTSVQKATMRDGSNVLTEEGHLLDGKKTGAWVSYYPKDGRVKSVTQYLNGYRNGLHLEMNDRGSVDVQAYFVDDILDGKYVKYKFGSRAEKEINYKMGKYHGLYIEYHSNGKKQKEVSYKDGVQDGKFRQFNDKEQVIMEYDYENGEKVSGGIITPPSE